MIYEFVGLPGSGKTHHAKELSERLSIPLIAGLTRTERFAGALMFTLHHPIVVVRLICGILRETHVPVGLLRHKLLFLFMNTIARETKASHIDDAVVDEGIFQFFYSLHEHPVTTLDAEQYLEIIKPFWSRSLIILDAPEALRRERMTSRNRTPRSFFGASYGEKWAAVLDVNHRVIKECLPRLLGDSRVTIEKRS